MNNSWIIMACSVVFATGCVSDQSLNQSLRLPDNWDLKRATERKLNYSIVRSPNSIDEIAQVEFERARSEDRDYIEGFQNGMNDYLQVIRHLRHESVEVKSEVDRAQRRTGKVSSIKDQSVVEYLIYADKDLILTGILTSKQSDLESVRPAFESFFSALARGTWHDWPRKTKQD